MDATSRPGSHSLVMQCYGDVMRERNVRLGEPGLQCIAYKPAGDMSQTSWRWWPVWLHLAASPKKHLLSFSPIISSLIQKCRICNQVTDGTVGSESRGWCKEVCFYQKYWSQWRQRCTLYLFYIMVWVNIHPDWLQGVPGVPVKLHWLHSVSLYVKWLKSMV